MPKGQHVRIVKPPSQKQQANLKKWGGSQIAIIPLTAGYPDRSWWVDLPRKEFDREAAAQMPRMKLVK